MHVLLPAMFFRTARVSALMTSLVRPTQSALRTLSAIRRTPGAIPLAEEVESEPLPAMVLAMCVPWPHPSSYPLRRVMPPTKSTWTTMRPVNSGIAAIPESMIATPTPRPVTPSGTPRMARSVSGITGASLPSLET